MIRAMDVDASMEAMGGYAQTARQDTKSSPADSTPVPEPPPGF